MNELRLTIPGDPVPWTVYTKRGEPPIGFLNMQSWQEQVRAYLRSAWKQEPLTGPVVLDCEFFLPWPDSAPQKRTEAIEKWYWKHLAMKPDLDNLKKAFSDSCGAKSAVYGRRGQLIRPAELGILFHGDQQIVSGNVRKDILRPTIYKNPKQGFTEIRFRALERS